MVTMVRVLRLGAMSSTNRSLWSISLELLSASLTSACLRLGLGPGPRGLRLLQVQV